MQYNQPFDQPTNPNAPYVDGNPAAGIEGSIVPAHSIEYDQREIVEVINYAYQHGYKDFDGNICNAPSNSDLTQLRKAIQGFVDVTPSWYIDTAITFTIHGTGASFPDLNTALEYLSKYIITHNGKVTLAVAAGRWNYGSSSITLDHPNADRITIAGANLLSYPVPSDFTVTGYSAAQRSNDRTNALNRLRTRFATEIDFTGANGIINQSTGMTLQNILIVVDRSSSGGSVFGGLTQAVGQLNVLNVSVCNSGSSGIGIGGGSLNLVNGGFLSASGSVVHGIGIAMGGNFWHGSNTQVWCTSNDANGVGAGFNCGANGYAQFFCNGNAGAGVMCSVMGQFQIGSQSQFNMNLIDGVFNDMGNFYTDSATGGAQFLNNGGPGLYSTVGSVSSCDHASFSGNVGNSIVCGSGSYVLATGATGVAGTSSPAVNTLSADGSYIAN